MQPSTLFLTDNGSLRPEATLRLRDLAAQLSSRTGHLVEAVSLLHSHKIPADQLGGQPATIVKRRLRECFAMGKRDFVVLPLFLGPSLAITDYLPEVVEELKKECPDFKLRIAQTLAGPSVEQPDIRLAAALADQLRQLGPIADGERLALVDHGTPIRPVNTLRNTVARQLADTLGHPVQASSMERREGPDYAFNEPLLEDLGELTDFSGGSLRLAMFFLLPGRHAGAGGDVATIAGGLVRDGAFASVSMAPLLGEHPLILKILEDRLAEVLRAA